MGQVKRRAALVALGAVAVLLAGCSTGIDPGLPDEPEGPAMQIELLDPERREAPWTVVVDVTEFRADRYHLDAGDGSDVRTNETGIFRIEYWERKAYGIVVQLGGDADTMAVPSSRGGRQPRPEPDKAPKAVWGVADLTQDGPSAVIIPTRNGNPQTSFYHWDEHRTVFLGEASKGENLYYQWKAERRYNVYKWVSGEGWVKDHTTDWYVPTGFNHEDRHRYQGKNWDPSRLFAFPGTNLTGKQVSTIEYRITLTVTDKHGRQDSAEVILTIHGAC